eukprot:15358033-Ditylum_brightwellii.AAC.1
MLKRRNNVVICSRLLVDCTLLPFNVVNHHNPIHPHCQREIGQRHCLHDSDSDDKNLDIDSLPHLYPCWDAKGRPPVCFGFDEYVVCQIEELNSLYDVDGYVNGPHPLAFAAKADVMDTPNYWQAMHQPDAD